MECTLWKIQYVDKAETPFDIRLNNHRSDVSDPNAIPACRHVYLFGARWKKKPLQDERLILRQNLMSQNRIYLNLKISFKTADGRN